MGRIAYFDFVAVIIYAIILYAAFVRKMTNGITNKMFLWLITVSMITAVADCFTAALPVELPLPEWKFWVVTLFTYVYFVFHNITTVIYLLFLFSVSRTGYIMSQPKKMMTAFLPYALTNVCLIVNIFTGWFFTVTVEEGYKRGPAIYVFYVVALLYALWGIYFLLKRKKVIVSTKWYSLFFMYVLNFIALGFQFLFPKLLIEMITTAMAELFITLLVLKPEDYMDYDTGMPSLKAYLNEIRKITVTNNRERIIILRFLNATELKKYLGDEEYMNFINDAIDSIRIEFSGKNLSYDMYFEQPGRIYIIMDNYDFDCRTAVLNAIDRFTDEIRTLEDRGVKIIPRFCEINYPEDAKDANTIINVGQSFHRYIPYEQVYNYAKDIIDTDRFRIENNMDTILTRAIREKKFEMYYQPIWSVKEKRFVSAEALIRLKDEEFGFISPAWFIPAAERKGLMIPIGDFVLESVFRFISENDFYGLGLSYIELNLSVAQCLQVELSEKIFALEKKYHVNPERVNLEITETTYENIGDITDMNIRTLSENGFSFSLDDYGTGYSNMQRLSKLPLKIIKIDKTLVDDMENKSGMSVIQNTVTMMKDIRKEIVAEGVETEEQLSFLSGLGVDFIQGYYFSKPLPEKDFVEFIKQRNYA